MVNLNDYDKRMVFGTRWVDTMSKSRITVQDLKKFGEATGLTNCPTPSASTNALLEALCTIRGHSMAGFDIVSAFPHADELGTDCNATSTRIRGRILAATQSR